MQLHILPLPQLAAAVAEHTAGLAAQASAARGRFSVALSGGSLPKVVGPALTGSAGPNGVNWSAWRVFWADERCVPLDSADSNYRLAREYLLDAVMIPPEQIYLPDTTLAPAETAAAYQATLERVLAPAPGEVPRFDLILLGMGEDGHTASLFPHHPLLAETERWVAPIFDSPKPPAERITLTLPVLNAARQVVFVVTGASKAGVLRRILETAAPAEPLPAQLVRPGSGQLHWFVDMEAATQLSSR